MKALFYSLIILFTSSLIGCPGAPTDDPSPVKKLPMCFYAVKDNSIIKSIKVFEDNGEATYFACGMRYEFSDSSELGADCDLNGEDVFLEDQVEGLGLGGSAKEISEHCLDNPIEGACEKWNCEEVLNLVPYPSGCYTVGSRASGICSDMWDE